LIATAKSTAGKTADKEYFNSLTTNALLVEASNAYDQGDYSLALGLYAKAAERADGQVMKSFRGLYLSFLKLGRLDEAEEVFGKLTDLGLRDNNLYVKMLFEVNETEFFGNPEDLIEYPIWIRQIAGRLKVSGNCMEISGHASHSGTEEYNNRLSQMRAERIQKLLQDAEPALSEKLQAIGCGFHDNWVGSGADNESDAIDRRVQFRVVECGLPSSKECTPST
jgi:tetratricopeptide (TPR) repeat protein